MAAALEQKRFPEATLTGIALPVRIRPAVPMTDAELMEFAARNSPFRVERNAGGELEIMTPVGLSGGRFEAYVIAQLTLWAEEQGGVAFSSNAGYSLPDGSMLSPDASWVSQSRWDSLSRREQDAFSPICPEFVIEVRSVSDLRKALEAKMQRWMANGAQLAWLVDPLDLTVTIYRPGCEPELLERPDFVAAGEPIAGFLLRAARFWLP